MFWLAGRFVIIIWNMGLRSILEAWCGCVRVRWWRRCTRLKIYSSTTILRVKMANLMCNTSAKNEQQNFGRRKKKNAERRKTIRNFERTRRFSSIFAAEMERSWRAEFDADWLWTTSKSQIDEIDDYKAKKKRVDFILFCFTFLLLFLFVSERTILKVKRERENLHIETMATWRETHDNLRPISTHLHRITRINDFLIYIKV